MENNVDITNTISDLIDAIKLNVIHKVKHGNDGRNTEILLNAYNHYQEDEKDCNDYIFDAENREELIYCMRRGLTFDKIQKMDVENNTPFFFFNWDENKVEMIKDIETLREHLFSSLDCLIGYVLLYVGQNEEYKEFYERFFVEDFEQTILDFCKQ